MARTLTEEEILAGQLRDHERDTYTWFEYMYRAMRMPHEQLTALTEIPDGPQRREVVRYTCYPEPRGRIWKKMTFE